jgi:ABC-type Mn2+/Zn2+ transport system permease subunit
VSGDAAVGIFSGAALAWGMIAYSIHDHLGRGGTAGWEFYLLGNITLMTPAATALAAGISGAIVVIVAALRRQILLYCFDPTLAEVTGVPVGLVHYLLIFMLSLVIIAGMRLAGNLLVPALLVLPGAAGLAVSRNIRTVMGIAIGTNIVATVLGVAVTWKWGFIAPGPAIVGILFLEFLVAYAVRGRAGAVE